MKLLLKLFLNFARIGLFTFGGGYAMLPLIEESCVEKHRWISHDEMMNVIVVAESTPGPISINCATFVGYRQKGLVGSLVATLGLILPPFLVIYLISMFLDRFLEITLVANAFRGIKVGVGFLIFNAALNMIKKMKKEKLAVGILTVTCLVMLVIDVLSIRFSSVLLMVVAGIFSLVVYKAKGGEVK